MVPDATVEFKAAAVEINLAIGRIFRMMSRPGQPGDVADYERCRALILSQLPDAATDYRPNYARDRLIGAQGDTGD